MRPLRAFPLPLKVGTDICQISRVYDILTTPRATRFVDRILAVEERPRFAALAGALPLVTRPAAPDQHQHRNQNQRHHQEATATAAAAAASASARDPEGWKAAAFMAGRYVPCFVLLSYCAK